jgi:hypothetical protein
MFNRIFNATMVQRVMQKDMQHPRALQHIFWSLCGMTVSTENATSPKSTKSRNSDSSVSRGTN